MTRTAWISAVGALLLCTCTQTDPPVPANALHDDATVYVIERGWHTDIGLPVEEIAGNLATLERPFPGVRFLTFGFGERQFLTGRQATTIAMLTALLPSRSALLMTALKATPDLAFGRQNVVTLRVSGGDLRQIEARIWAEFEQSPAGTPMPLGEGPYPGSVFYAGRDTYDGFYTCNTWTATMLRAGGLPMPTTGVLFVGQVMGMARWIEARQTSLGRG